MIQYFYPLLALPLSLISLTYYLYLPKIYSEHYEISLSQLGIWLCISRIFDAVTDPICGKVSDYLYQKGISRFVFILPGAVLLAISIVIIGDPKIISANINLSYNSIFIIFSFLMYLGSTLVTVPYETLGVGISNDSSKRTLQIGLRDGMVLVGILLSSLLPILIGKNLKDSVSLLTKSYAILIIIFSLLLTFIKFEKIELTKNTSKIIQIFKNRDFLILLRSFVINSLGAAIPASLFFFYSKNILNLNENSANIALLVYFLLGIICVPVWIYLARKYSKKSVWFSSQLINSISFIPVFFLKSGDYQQFIFFISLSAIGYGGALIIPSIIQAEIINNDRIKSEQLNDGLYIGAWSVAKKLSQALGSGIALYLIGINLEFNGRSYNDFVLSFLYCLLPSILSILSIYCAKSLKA